MFSTYPIIFFLFDEVREQNTPCICSPSSSCHTLWGPPIKQFAQPGLEGRDRCRSSLPLIIYSQCQFKMEMVNTTSWLLIGVKLHWPVFWLCPRSFLEMFCCCRFRMRCCSCFSQRRRPLLKAGSSSISFWTRTSGLREPSAARTPSLDDDNSPSSLLASSSCKTGASKWAGRQWGSWWFIYLIRIHISFHIAKTILPLVHTNTHNYNDYNN